MRTLPPRVPRRARGMILIIVSGMLVLLCAMGMLLLQGAALGARGAMSHLAEGTARLSAISGAEYAGARLGRDPLPRWTRTVANRGEDWACRDAAGSGPQALLNPSYSHGESWRDTGSVAGAYEVNGDGLGPDRDGDEAFSAWTGRLRTGAGAARFTLAVDGLDGRIPLNAGYLLPGDGQPDGLDSNQNGVIDDADEMDGDMDDNGVPECRELPPANEARASVSPFLLHGGLAHMLDNLGVVCGIGARREDVPTGSPLGSGEPIQLSRLGLDLIQNRPQGGYRSWKEVEETLLGLVFAPGEGGGYTHEDLERVRPFIDLGPYEGRSPLRGFFGNVPVSIQAAPVQVLQSAWRYLAGPPIHASFAGDGTASIAGCWYTRTGAAGAAGTLRYFNGQIVPLLIYPDEAERLAARVEALRQEGPLSWRRILDDFVEKARRLAPDPEALFPRDAEDLSPDPVFRRNWVQAKVDLAFQSVSPEHYPWADQGIWSFPARAWGGWGIDRDGDPANGVQQRCFSGLSRPRRVRYPSAHGAGWGADPLRPFKGVYPNHPPVFTCALPTRFHVESGGSVPGGRGSIWRIVRGDFAWGERLERTTQEDFENWRGGEALLSKGIVVHDPAAFIRRRRQEVDDPAAGRAYPQVVTLPAWSRRAHLPAWTAGRGYPEAHGAVALAAREAGLQGGALNGAALYFPLSEDYDGALDSAAPPESAEPGAGLEFWRSAAVWYRFYDSPIRIPVGCLAGEDRLSPYHLTMAGQSGTFQWPGFHMHSIPGAYLDRMSIEGWFTPTLDSSPLGCTTLRMEGRMEDGTSAGIIRIATWRSESDPSIKQDRHGFFVSVFVAWRNCWEDASQAIPPARTFFIQDRDGTTASARGTHHIVLTAERRVVDSVLPETELRLFVDGSDHADGVFPPGSPWTTPGPMRWFHATLDNRFPIGSGGYPAGKDGWLVVSDTERFLALQRVDEIRLWADLLSPEDVRSLYRRDRFVRKGTFLSPVYVVPGGVSLAQAQWTGIVPPLFCRPDASGNPDPTRPIDPFEVTMEAFSRPPDPGEDPDLLPLAPGFPVVLGSQGEAGETPLGPGGSGTLYGLSGLGKVSAFRYKVRFKCQDVAGVLNDTPVFESIWLILRRGGGSWSAVSLD